MKGHKPVFGPRYLVAIAAGLLLSAAFPKIGIAGFAWVAPGLMLAAALGTRSGESFRIGYVGGLAYALASYYWLLHIPYRWLGIPFGPAAGWLGLSGYLALYPAVWVWILARLWEWRSAAEPGTVAPWTATPLTARWWSRSLWCLSAAILWVGLEMILARLFSGFPWDLLGVSQYRMVPLIQLASLTGVYGISFVVIWVSVSLLSAALSAIRQPTTRALWVGETLVPVLTVAILFSWGFRELRDQPRPTRSITATLIQPSIPQTLIWDTGKDDERFAGLVALTRAALTNETDLVIWPEAALPKLLRYDRPTYEAVTGLAREHGIWMIIGADDAEPREGAGGENRADYFNSSFLISPAGVLENSYKKRSLVIFGEYVPLERWLPFLKFFTPVEGGFKSGDRPVQFHLPELGLQVSVLICFEDIFPGLGREATEPGTDFLVNITNNGWFGESAAQWQHAATAVLRAVENHVPLIRCANNGLTCWVDSRGRVREIFRDATGSVYGPGFMRFELPLEPTEGRAMTVYNRHGDWFGWSCVVMSAGGVSLVIAGRRAVKVVNAAPAKSNPRQ